MCKVIQCLVLLGIFVFLTTLQAEEKLFIKLDEKQWKIGFEDQSANDLIIELVVAPDTILDWSELFTIQKFKNLTITAEEFLDVLKEQSAKNLPPGQKMEFKILEKAPFFINEMLFIYQKLAENNFNEYDLGRLIETEDGLYYLQYSTKNKAQFDQVKVKWVARLKEAYLASHPKSISSSGHWLSLSSQGVFDGDKPLKYEPKTQIYIDKKAGFSLPISKDWVIEKQPPAEQTEENKESQDRILLLFSNPIQTAFGGVAYQDQKDTQERREAKQIGTAFWNHYKKAEPKIKLIRKGEIETALGTIGFYLLVENEENKGWITFFNHPNHSYRLELWSPTDHFEKQKFLFEHIITNFNFFSSSSTSIPQNSKEKSLKESALN